MPRILTETTGPPEAITGHRYRVRVIEGPRWGSSGYYSSEALDNATTTLSGGTKVFMDHPSATEDRDRPERSLRDLVGHITGPITRQDDGIHAVMEVLPHWSGIVSSLASSGDLAMSIRAMAEFHPGEAEGRHGPIIDRITDFLSVDLVTEAGAGGRVLELIESTRTATEATANDRRDQLRAAITAAYATGDDDYVWVRDFDYDKSLVWFEQADRIYQQAFTATDTDVALTGSPVEVRAITTYHPVDAAGPTSREESTMPQIDEAEYQRLTESAARTARLETELAQANERAVAAEAARDEAAAAAAAERDKAVEAAIAASDLPEQAKARVREAMTPESDVAAVIKAEADYLAAVAPARPARFGTPDAAESTTKPARSPWGREIKES